MREEAVSGASHRATLNRPGIIGRVAQKNGTIGRCWLAVRHESVSRKQVPCQVEADEAKTEAP